jgi:hypothetical protein
MAKVERKKNPQYLEVLHGIKELQHKQGKVGWFSNDKFPDGTPVAATVAWNEYGVAEKNIPPRPVVRPAIDSYIDGYAHVVQRVAKNLIAGKLNAHEAMSQICEYTVGNIRREIVAITSPPLSPRTVAKRMAKYSNKRRLGALDKPRVDTGLTLASVSKRIEDV